MEFRSLKMQYQNNKAQIDENIDKVIAKSNFISGEEIKQLEQELAAYVGVKECITCANGTDALSLALMTWNVGRNDAVFVPDFTFFSSGEVVAFAGATPVFVDVKEDTCNIDPEKLENSIKQIIHEGKLTPKVIVAVDLFGQPADFVEIRRIADKYNLYILEDGAQGFGGRIEKKMACSFGDIATTSFFPMKPLGCYGDGGAIFTDNNDWADLIRSYCVHGKGSMKYDNIRIGMNSRLDTIQAAILLAKFPLFVEKELDDVNEKASYYTKKLPSNVKVPVIRDGFYSSWAQYTIQLADKLQREKLQSFLKSRDIPSFIYYPKPMHSQKAFSSYKQDKYPVTDQLCDTVLSLPISPYIAFTDIDKVIESICECLCS